MTRVAYLGGGVDTGPHFVDGRQGVASGGGGNQRFGRA